MTGIWILIFITSFLTMEFNAWALHKYVMHGCLWFLHRDHHVPHPTRKYQFNDAFAIFFAVPSFLLILFGRILQEHRLDAIGFGIMAYGLVYFLVHEVLIHRRWKFLRIKNNTYLQALNAAHKIHHANPAKEKGRNFGMLIVPLHYYKMAWQNVSRPRMVTK